MKYIHNEGVLKQTKKIWLIGVAVAFVAALTISFIGNTNAAPNTEYTSVDFTDLSLVTDRQDPSGGATIAPNLLTLNIDNTKASASPGFYRTEGLQGTLPETADTIKSDLYLDTNWDGKDIRAGLWGITHSDTDVYTAWPILEYTTVGEDNFTGWRMYDTMVTGDWTNLPAVDATLGSWHSVEINFNSATNNYDYYINNVLVGSLTAQDGLNVYDMFDGVIFNNYNFATNDPADDYSVQWRNFAYGKAKILEYSVNGGGHILEQGDAKKRKDWNDVSIGLDVMAYNTGVEGSATVRFHNTGLDVVDKTTFHAKEFTDFSYFPATNKCDGAMNFTAYGEWNGDDNAKIIVRAGDNLDTLRVTLKSGSMTYDTNNSDFVSVNSCHGNARTELDNGNITIKKYE